jgi:hypothetical protein
MTPNDYQHAVENDDPAARLAYADHLHDQGDEHGESTIPLTPPVSLGSRELLQRQIHFFEKLLRQRG